MRTGIYKIFILLLLVHTLISCLGDKKEIELSSSSHFVSLKFTKDSKIPGLESAIFTLQYDKNLGDSVIVNLDSLPHKTKIDKVLPVFSFRSSSQTYLVRTDTMKTGLDTVLLSDRDTVDFTRAVRIINFAGNKKNFSSYRIKVNVHQVEPELYVWQRKAERIYTHEGSMQQALFFRDRFFFYVSSGYHVYLYTSPNAVQWTNEPVTGLPANGNFLNIRISNDKLFLAHEDGLIYTSSDGKNWEGINPSVSGYTISSILFTLEENLWGVFRQDAEKQYYFATSADGLAWTMREEVPVNFPITDFASLVFKTRTNKPKALVLGGNAADGTFLSNVWSVQKNVYNEYKWVNFSLDNPSFKSLSGVSLIRYDDKLLLFGGADENGNMTGTGYMESIDEGLNWRNTDTTFNVIRDTVQNLSYQPRSYQSVICDETSHYIYLIGGRNKDAAGVHVFSDVWVGKLNRMSFPKQ